MQEIKQLIEDASVSNAPLNISLGGLDMDTKTRTGLLAVKYRKAFSHYVVYYVAEIRTGRKVLAMKTMYKTEKPNGASRVRNEPGTLRRPL